MKVFFFGSRYSRFRFARSGSRQFEIKKYQSLRFRSTLHPGVSPNSIHHDIKELQSALVLKGELNKNEVSGFFDAQTEAAVRRIQRQRDVVEDGVVGPITWAAILYPDITRQGSNKPEDVIRLQEKLDEESLGPKLVVDGSFGPKTERLLKKFQRSCNLRADGICGPVTWAFLMGERPRKRTSQSTDFLSNPMLKATITQVWVIVLIAMGVTFSPFDNREELTWVLSAELLVRSWVLVCLVSPVATRLSITNVEVEKFSLPLCSLCVLIGALHDQIFQWLISLLTSAS